MRIDSSNEIWEEVTHAATLLREARYGVALTGAGISTPSGIPDFRSPEFGLWERNNPMEVASIRAFRRNPQAFYEWFRPMLNTLLTAEPNPGHRALAGLEEGGWLKAILTQNIDDLHQRAGSAEVLELHGHLRDMTCLSCYRVLPTAVILEDYLRTGAVPRCDVCGGVMKPNTILMGEQLPAQAVNAAMGHVRQADLMLVAGSSLTVVPASHLPHLVVEGGGRLVVINLSPTYIDEAADVVIHADVAEVLPLIARLCIEGAYEVERTDQEI